jgi:Calcineurin-like phosphoesterase
MAHEIDHFDIIGDIHGHAEHLHRLLKKMDYWELDGCYYRPDRKVLFLGDFIDRGPDQMEVMRIVRSMCESGSAQAIMGNHEFNAIGWVTKGPNGDYLRSHDPVHRDQHQAFLDQVGEDSFYHRDAISWFRSLPAFMDLGSIRIVHACWHDRSIEIMKAKCLDQSHCFTPQGFIAAHDKGSELYDAVEVVLKGPEQKLPDGIMFHDKSGHLREHARIKWWNGLPTLPLRDAVLGMEGREGDLPDLLIEIDHVYSDAMPVFFGHYWLKGQPYVTAPNAQCLDFSVAKSGYLTAYRWSGEIELKQENLVWC